MWAYKFIRCRPQTLIGIKVTDGVWTRIIRNHNPVHYQVCHSHSNGYGSRTHYLLIMSQLFKPFHSSASRRNRIWTYKPHRRLFSCAPPTQPDSNEVPEPSLVSTKYFEWRPTFAPFMPAFNFYSGNHPEFLLRCTGRNRSWTRSRGTEIWTLDLSLPKRAL